MKPQKGSAGSTILMVEDEKEVLKLVKTMLERFGSSVITAKNGHEAVSAIKGRNNEVDCVITDLLMPGMDGWETLACIKEISPDTPVVLASGFDEAQVMEGKWGQSPDAYIQKPYRMSELKAVLKRVLY